MYVAKRNVVMAYPANLDSALDLLIAINNKSTSLTSGIDTGSVTIEIGSTAGWPSEGVASINNEVIYYNDISGSALILNTPDNRGYDGTNPASHNAGARVELRWIAAHHNRLSTKIRDLQVTLGLNPKGEFDDVAAALVNCTPVTEHFDDNTWVVTHTKNRIVHVQLYELVAPNTYVLFNAPIEQDLGAGTVTVNIGETKEGYIIYT